MQSTFIQRINRREVWILLSSLSLLWVMLHPPKALVARHHAWKARQALEAANQARANGDWQSAQARAEQGLHWAPRSYDLRYLLVITAAAQEKAIDPALLARTFLDSSASSEQRTKLLTIALDGGDQVTFSRLYNTLNGEGRSFPGIMVQRMRLSLQLGRHAEVAQLFEQLSEDEHTPTARYLRIGALVQAGAYLEAQKAISQFLVNTEDESADAWQAVRLLNSIPQGRLHRPALANVVQWISTAKNASITDRLIAERVELSGMEPSQRPAYLQGLVARYGKSDAAAVGHWLIELGFPDLALSIPELSPESALNHITTYEARLQGLVSSRHWQEAWHWLQEPPKGGHVVLQWLARAQVAHQLNQDSDRRQSLARAIDSAAIMSSENNFFVISEVAHQLDEPELATQAAMAGVQVPSTIAPPAPFFLPVLRYLWMEDRLDEFRQLNRILLLREPGDLQRNNDELYLSLLLDENPKLQDIVAIGRKLNAARPDDLSFSTTLAWALLRSGEAQESQKVLNNPKLDWSQAGPADFLVRDLARRAADGEDSGKSELKGTINIAQLCSAEQELLLKVWQSQQAATQ